MGDVKYFCDQHGEMNTYIKGWVDIKKCEYIPICIDCVIDDIDEELARWLLKLHNKGQSTFCYCPGCGLELCNSESWYSKSELMRFRCIKCGKMSVWLFDLPTPILLRGGDF